MKPLYSGHHRSLKIVFVIKRCPLNKRSSQIGLFCFRTCSRLLRYSATTLKSVKKQLLWEERVWRQSIRGYRVFRKTILELLWKLGKGCEKAKSLCKDNFEENRQSTCQFGGQSFEDLMIFNRMIPWLQKRLKNYEMLNWWFQKTSS